MRETTRTLLVVSVGLLLSVLAIASIGAYRTIGQLQSNIHSIRHSRALLETLDQLVSTVKDAETGQRGYLLTGNDDYLGPYKAALSNHRDDVERLASLTADDSNQHARFTRLRELISSKLEELAKTVAMQKEGDTDAALQLVRTDDGKRLMGQIQSLANQMQEDERELMLNQKWDNANVYRSASFSVIVIGIFSLIALAIFVRMVLRHATTPIDRHPPSTNHGNPSAQPVSMPDTA